MATDEYGNEIKKKKPSLLNRYIMSKTGANKVVGGLKNEPAKKARAVPAPPRLKPAPPRAAGRERPLDDFRKLRD